MTIESQNTGANGIERNNILTISPEAFPQHTPFLEAVMTTAKLLQTAGVSPDGAMIISGGGIALRQLAKNNPDRIPTDLDIVIHYQNEDEAFQILQRVCDILRQTATYQQPNLITQPRPHWQFVFPNPILEAVYSNNGLGAFPVDFMTTMTTIFPDEAHIPKLRGVKYQFPIDNRALFDYASWVVVGDQKVKITHPAFALFYKLTMNRNGDNSQHPNNPKQDDDDIIRMAQLGLIDFDDPGFKEVMKTMTYGDKELMKQIMAATYRKVNNG